MASSIKGARDCAAIARVTASLIRCTKGSPTTLCIAPTANSTKANSPPWLSTGPIRLAVSPFSPNQRSIRWG